MNYGLLIKKVRILVDFGDLVVGRDGGWERESILYPYLNELSEYFMQFVVCNQRTKNPQVETRGGNTIK